MVMISVIIPIYNAEQYLRECLDSLQNQKFVDVEYICVDDGSIDSSKQICEAYAKNDPRFKVHSQINGGPAKARNYGMSLANGKYLCFVDSDDLLSPNALKIMYKYAERNNLDILVHSANILNMSAEPIPSWINGPLHIKKKIYQNFSFDDIFKISGCRPFLWQHFIRREIIEKNQLSMDEKLKVGEDQAFEIQYFSKSKKVQFISNKLYTYRVNNPNSIMSGYSTQLMNKMYQHLEMVDNVLKNQTILSSSNEVTLIEWILEVMYWDLLKLLYYDQQRFTGDIMKYLKQLNILDHKSELSNIDALKYLHIKILEENQGNPQKILEEFKAINDKIVSNQSN